MFTLLCRYLRTCFLCICGDEKSSIREIMNYLIVQYRIIKEVWSNRIRFKKIFCSYSIFGRPFLKSFKK